MLFGNFFNIGSLKIPEAVRQKLLEGCMSGNDFENSVWQEVFAPSTNNIPKQPSEQQIEPPPAEAKSKSPERQLRPQEEYTELPFNENGTLNLNELTIDKLKAKFPKSEYDVMEFGNEGSTLLEIQRIEDGKFIMSCRYTTLPDGQKKQSIVLDHNGILTFFDCQNDELMITTYRTENDINKIDTNNYYDENGELYRKDTWNEDSTGFLSQYYSNGILYSERDVSSDFTTLEERQILSYHLILDVETRALAVKRGYGFLPKTDNIENMILNGISKRNIDQILEKYREEAGSDLFEDIIDNTMGLEYEKRKELLTHLTKTYCESKELEYGDAIYHEGIGIGFELQFALKNNDKEMLKDALDKVNEDNVEFVLRTIFRIKDNDNFTDFSDKLYRQLTSILGDDAETYIQKFSDAMIQHIDKQGGYTDDLIEDMTANKGKLNRNIIDFTRLLNRCKAGQNSTATGKPDGKIDINNIQQRGTGDCWLLAAVLSATNKNENENGLAYVNGLLSVDEQGNVTVELKGVGKTYVISAEEIEKSNHLASGDPDMRAIEIAIDKYMKEYSYDRTDGLPSDLGNYSQADINGDYENLAYYILFGNEKYDENPDILNNDYNSENYVYTLSMGNKPNIKATVLGGAEQSEVDLIGRHAYAVKGSDERYIYLINPHNSSETLQVERTALQTKNPRICSAAIHKTEIEDIMNMQFFEE